jgi:hypothetical protein
MIAMTHRKLLAVFLLAALSCVAQSTPDAKPPVKVIAPAVSSGTATPALDLQALVKETEQVDMQRRKMGMFWWIPYEFWEAVSQKQGQSEEVTKAFQPFKNYNVFIVAIGTLGIGQATWADESEIKKNIVLRDQHGNAYKPLVEPPEDLRPLVELMHPVFKSVMGNFGEGMQFVVFPLKDGAGNVFADARKRSEMSLDVTGLMGTPTSTYTWKFPLTALSPPKYCPVGKEKVDANWKYCPWHGNKLEDLSEAPGSPATSAK